MLDFTTKTKLKNAQDTTLNINSISIKKYEQMLDCVQQAFLMAWLIKF